MTKDRKNEIDARPGHLFFWENHLRRHAERPCKKGGGRRNGNKRDRKKAGWRRFKESPREWGDVVFPTFTVVPCLVQNESTEFCNKKVQSFMA
ncbi:hypothetical protein B4135_3152 [Caldibacillus debilis]|uniref:Uncharacterized protein n=1 Tax=Caldibacillus debilis TaxID=301148 RepID=A0A150LHP1_9BACI|nr:hypothetical protein B4135_3152 [Caldibacillus debilis]